MPSNEMSSFAGNGNKTFEPGKSNITNPTDDHELKNNGHDSSTDSTTSDKHNVKEDKGTMNRNKKSNARRWKHHKWRNRRTIALFPFNYESSVITAYFRSAAIFQIMKWIAVVGLSTLVNAIFIIIGIYG